MHTYPADLREGAVRLGALLARSHVLCVDMGHTHYHELANDGGTIFMTTRSTGQTEEGPAGFSIAAIDDGCVSWRFKALQQAWPFVLVTQPADRRLVTRENQIARGSFAVRAKVVGNAPIEAVVRVDNGDWAPMAPVPGDVALWGATATLTCRDFAAKCEHRAKEKEVARDLPSLPDSFGWMEVAAVLDPPATGYTADKDFLNRLMISKPTTLTV